MAQIISANFSENAKRRRGRPRAFVGQPTRNEQKLCYARVAHEVLSQFPEDRFQWILKSKTLLTELGRIKDPATMIEIADAISMERRTQPNGKTWPTAQTLRRTVHQWSVGNTANGSHGDLVKELEALIEDCRARHPKLKKSQVTKALSYVLFVIKGTPWPNNRPDRIVRKHGSFEVDSYWPTDGQLDKEFYRRRLGKEILEDKRFRFGSEI